MLPGRVDVHADLFFDPEDLGHGHVSLPHVLDGFHEHPRVSALLRHQADDVHLVDLVTDLELVELRVQRLEILAHRVEQTHEERLLALDQIDVDLGPCLYELLVQVVRCLHGAGDVDELRELELKVFLQLVHLDAYLVELSDTVLLEVVHRALRVVNVNQILLLAIFAQIRMQFVPLERGDSISVHSQNFIFTVLDALKFFHQLSALT